RVDLEQDLSLLHQITFLIVLPDQVARDLCPYSGVDHAVGSADPLVLYWDVFLNDLHDFHYRRLRRWFLLFFASCQEDGNRTEDNDGSKKCMTHFIIPFKFKHTLSSPSVTLC